MLKGRGRKIFSNCFVVRITTDKELGGTALSQDAFLYQMEKDYLNHSMLCPICTDIFIVFTHLCKYHQLTCGLNVFFECQSQTLLPIPRHFSCVRATARNREEFSLVGYNDGLVVLGSVQCAVTNSYSNSNPKVQ